MTTELDAAILANRVNPSDANRERVLTAMRQHLDRFHRQLASEYIERTS